MQTGPYSLYIDDGCVINLKTVICAYWLSKDRINENAKKTLRVLLMGETINSDETAIGFEFDDEEGDEFIQALIDFHELAYPRK